jgi:hypothetical protein
MAKGLPASSAGRRLRGLGCCKEDEGEQEAYAGSEAAGQMIPDQAQAEESGERCEPDLDPPHLRRPKARGEPARMRRLLGRSSAGLGSKHRGSCR